MYAFSVVISFQTAGKGLFVVSDPETLNPKP